MAREWSIPAATIGEFDQCEAGVMDVLRSLAETWRENARDGVPDIVISAGLAEYLAAGDPRYVAFMLMFATRALVAHEVI